MIFTQMDAKANDIPRGFTVTDHPTIYVVPKNNIPIKYEGKREMNDLVKFIDKHTNMKTEL